MKIADTHSILKKGFASARQRLEHSSQFTFVPLHDGGFKLAVLQQKSRFIAFSFPIKVSDENRLTQVGVGEAGELHLLRQTPIEQGFDGEVFAEQSGIPVALPSKRERSTTNPVWLDFGAMDAESFAATVSDCLTRYLATKDAQKGKTI